MKGLKIFAALLVGGALLVGAAPAGAGTTPKHPRVFRHYVACGNKMTIKRNPLKLDPTHTCAANQVKGAFFYASKGNAICRTKNGTKLRCVRYRVCVDFPKGRTLCAGPERAIVGRYYKNEITSSELGRHKVSWFIGRKRVGTYYFRITR